MNSTPIVSENAEKSISVFENADGKQCVSARELHEKLESNERFSKWWDRFSGYGFIENVDFMRGCTKKYAPKNQFTSELQEIELEDYEITIEMAKQICMLQRSDKGREYREYFLNLEKAWNSPEAIMSRALQIANKTLEDAKNQIVIQQKQIEELTPDAESWRKFAESDGTFSATNVAKCLGIKRDDLLKWLELKHYIMRERSDNPNKKGKYQGTAQGIEYGYIKNYVYTNDNISCIQFHLTPKGMQKVQKAFSNYDKGVDYVKKAIENTPEMKVESLFRSNNILGLKAE